MLCCKSLFFATLVRGAGSRGSLLFRASKVVIIALVILLIVLVVIRNNISFFKHKIGKPS